MKNKIKTLTIKGLRGIRETVTLALEGESVLIYGDNGSGKSSITDAVEWFFKNKIDHLSGEEIGRSGQDALRNIFLKEDEEGFVNMTFSQEELGSKKSLFLKKEALQSRQTNQSDEFNAFLDASQKENLILRCGDLTDFILASKKEKLDYLSAIIGFSEVTKTRDILRRTVSDLKKEIKIKNFDNQINQRQARLIANLGQNVTSDDQFFDALQEAARPLALNKRITTFTDIEEILELVKKPEDSGLIEVQAFYRKISDWLANAKAQLDALEESYEDYRRQYQKIIENIENLSKILLENLLSEGVKIIRQQAIKEDRCPLCGQPKNRDELLEELKNRIEELKKAREEKTKLEELKNSSRRVLNEIGQPLRFYLASPLLDTEDNRQLKEILGQIKESIEHYLPQLEPDISLTHKPKPNEELAVDRQILNKAGDFCREKAEQLKAAKKDDLKFDIHSKIVSSKEAYLEIKRLKKEKLVIERQQSTFETIYSQFLKRQKEALESFLAHFSTTVNDLYQFMNPDEKVEDIKLIPLEKDDDLVGLTLVYSFYKSSESPPQKYLSESHLNCLGIAFYLTSVLAFNKINGYFILDDIISSFDSHHRQRFARLLMEKFSDYQIMALTHEKDWFDLLLGLAKGKGWQAYTIKWDEREGGCINNTPET
jgi:DNA repair exonuclease SbcCD ATPase subunit